MVCINPRLPAKNTPRNSTTILNMEMAGWTKKIHVSTCVTGWFQNRLFVPRSNKQNNQKLTIRHWLAMFFISSLRVSFRLLLFCVSSQLFNAHTLWSVAAPSTQGPRFHSASMIYDSTYILVHFLMQKNKYLIRQRYNFVVFLNVIHSRPISFILFF